VLTLKTGSLPSAVNISFIRVVARRVSSAMGLLSCYQRSTAHCCKAGHPNFACSWLLHVLLC
jgi:hypothetical protein